MRNVWRYAGVLALAAGTTFAQDELLFQSDRLKDQMEHARESLERARDGMALRKEGMPFDFDFAPLLAQKAFPFQDEKARAAAEKAREAAEKVRTKSAARDLYSRGLDSLDRRNYERALTLFEEYYRLMADNKDARADGALYWKAYTLHKLGRRPDALAALAQMEKTFPSSRWLNDAKALQLEVNQSAGQAVSPEGQSDEDLKLLAINSLMNTDAERTVPLLEKLLGDPKTSLALKGRALFVLAQSRSPRARDVLAGVAKGKGNPDLQLRAVEYMGAFGSKENRQALADVYTATSDPAVKRAVLRAYMIGHDKEHLLAAAKSEPNAELRLEAIRQLGISGGQAELAQLYAAETNADVKRSIIRSLGITGGGDKLADLAKSEKDPTLRSEAIRAMGIHRREQTAGALAAMYGAESDKNVKREIIHSLFIQGGAKQLVDLARKESDPALKQEIVHRLSIMHSKEATDYMMELLNK